MKVDGLKHSSRTDRIKGRSVGLLAREVMRWAHESFGSDDGSLIGQREGETIDEYAVADNAILACSMYLILLKQKLRAVTSRRLTQHA